jgi:F-type H+-transporting ATPase subunit epsilon
MQLKILLPFRVFAAVDEVTRIVVPTRTGSFGLRPQRLDCAATLVAGLLSYSTPSQETHLAIDEGVLVKTGAEVLVCVRHAIGGAELGGIGHVVAQEILRLDEQERIDRSTLARLETGLVRRFLELRGG